jgi:hypothetical protein
MFDQVVVVYKIPDKRSIRFEKQHRTICHKFRVSKHPSKLWIEMLETQKERSKKENTRRHYHEICVNQFRKFTKFGITPTVWD